MRSLLGMYALAISEMFSVVASHLTILIIKVWVLCDVQYTGFDELRDLPALW